MSTGNPPNLRCTFVLSFFKFSAASFNTNCASLYGIVLYGVPDHHGGEEIGG